VDIGQAGIGEGAGQPHGLPGSEHELVEPCAVNGLHDADRRSDVVIVDDRAHGYGVDDRGVERNGIRQDQ
jgi:hypothetical protein